jgi:hypothetical protein
MRFHACLLSTLLLGSVMVFPSAVSAALSQQTYIAMPATNMPDSGWVASDSRVAYVLDNPLIGPGNNPNTGQFFHDYHAQVFLVDLRAAGGHFTTSQPRLLFTGPKGRSLALGSVLGGWLVYEAYTSTNIGGPWAINARNITTGKRIVIDTREMEGVPSLTPVPRSDGHTVAWQSWTTIQGRTTSVIRTYNLRTGQRTLVVHGGTPNTWAYTGVSISGQRLVIEKDQYKQQRSQIRLFDLHSGKMSTLSPAGQAASEPWISGDIAVWKIGWRFSNGKGVGLVNLRTGARKLLTAYNAEGPQTTANRFVAFASGGKTRVELYDILTGSRQVLAPISNGQIVGSVVHAADHILLYSQGKLCGDPNFVCPGQVVVLHLP